MRTVVRHQPQEIVQVAFGHRQLQSRSCDNIADEQAIPPSAEQAALAFRANAAQLANIELLGRLFVVEQVKQLLLCIDADAQRTIHKQPSVDLGFFRGAVPRQLLRDRQLQSAQHAPPGQDAIDPCPQRHDERQQQNDAKADQATLPDQEDGE
jgi:hypothetical protein